MQYLLASWNRLLLYVVSLSATLIIISSKPFVLSICAPLEIIIICMAAIKKDYIVLQAAFEQCKHTLLHFYSQLCIVAPHPTLPMALLEYQLQPLTQPPTKGQWTTPVTLGMRLSPQQRLPVWLMGCGDLYQLVHVCEVDTITDNSYCIDRVFTTQLWIVAPLPPLAMDLLEHRPAQLLEGWWPTPVTLGMRSSPQQWPHVWLIECGDLHQLVSVCYSAALYSNHNNILLTQL